MKDFKNLGTLTLLQMLESVLGRTEAESILEAVQNAVDSGARGEELKKLIHQILCKYSVTNIEVYHVLCCVVT